MNHVAHNLLRLVRAGIDTYQQPVVYMRRDCEACRWEGFSAFTRVLVRSGGRELVAKLNVVNDNRFGLDVAALSEVGRDCRTAMPRAAVPRSSSMTSCPPDAPRSRPWDN